jgi:hypothetical protein
MVLHYQLQKIIELITQTNKRRNKGDFEKILCSQYCSGHFCVFLPLTESNNAALRAAIFIFIIKYQHGIFALSFTTTLVVNFFCEHNKLKQQQFDQRDS